MEQYIVTGMSCAACQARVEKAVNNVPGVTACSVSLLTNSMGVEGNVNSADIIRAVENAGYGASLKGAQGKEKRSSLESEADALADRETPKLKRRLLLSAGFLCVLMYLTMGAHMFGWPLPAFLVHNHLGLTLTQMLLAGIVMIINHKFFTSGFSSLMHGAPNMDTLVAMGSLVSFGWSTFVFYEMCSMITKGADNMALMDLYHNQLYFESAAMIPAFITIGKMLEAMSKGRTTDALKSLMKLAPKTAFVMRDGEEKEVGIEEVGIGDVFVIRPGDSVPVDGIVLEGESAVNESFLTGESIPVDKAPGDKVSAASINQSGYMKCQATRVGEDTTLAQIIHMVSDAAATKAPIARIADKVSGVFVPVVIGIAFIVICGWLIAGRPVSFALARGISVLVIACPCALGLATPVAIMVGNGIGARNGVLFKTSEALETLGRIQIIALDKTGTITSGTPEVTDIYPVGVTEETLLEKAYAVEKKSEHPLAGAVTAYAREAGIRETEADSFEALPGNGLKAKIGSHLLHAGNEKLMRTLTDMPAEALAKAQEFAGEGKTPLFFEEDGRLLGIIAVADTVKADSPQAVQELRNLGLEVVMLTGDNERTANAIGRQAGVDKVIAGVLPEGKEEVIRKLSERGKTAMVGDGINDAPALTRADTGIAIGAGTDVAIDSADVVLMNSKLSDVPAAVRLSRAVLRNIHENLFWAFFYNLICIPLAAGLLKVQMNPMYGAAAMSLSSFTVCMNALRLNLFKIHDAGHDKPLKNRAKPEEPAPATPETVQEETILTEGMMCEHCEARVEKALSAVKGITEAKADHHSGKVVIKYTEEPDPEEIRKAIEDADYTYCGIDGKEEKKMRKTLKVEGMMCMHCEATVKKALEALEGVESAEVSHEKGTAVVTLTDDVADEVLTKAVEDKDYKVLGIEA